LISVLAHQAVELTPSEYSSNTANEMQGQHSTPASVQADDGRHVLQATTLASGNTVLPKDIPAYDTSKSYLGKLCPKGHVWHDTGQSLRRRRKGDCHECDKQRTNKHNTRPAKRQALSAVPTGEDQDT